MDTDFDLESLVHVEQTFYEAGYADGHAHGRIHGLIEGRALGREKGFEMWEELGFYEGFARTWSAILVKTGKADDRASQHIKHLLDLIARFPRVNPSSTNANAEENELDISKLQRQIRSRYKALCSSLGVRPRLLSAEIAALDREDGSASPREDTGMDLDLDSGDGMGKRVAKGSAIPVWKIDNATGARKAVTNQDLNF
ncbi:hypothetical protein NLJ89_g9964 [Agrocybe chaxingu]|uniref:Essential protein Yae1 N-terminal domain-containing protein n=1 Tax=Agrocybe chaxingu TaxID=84603 RepID=A0A9W8JPQ5_9AGAR|nr:hypothetical protein NLJ89_g9964 [Agrocybe chaxingu]